ncbi:hydroxyacid dehydrogenase [Bifidobacterium callimiconis]|uniref:2-hydroxyacid dehydrogenase n=1 Tax=Bifidobacterium callimiconis TaxID=2306973 RepID=A0A430F9P3_9BIFI|nr:hydroxyacid dehydrogenase [Bifidobacterium callimiconis]RSX49528.1 2-hydroxyacid dehydrogenase [Bifidobacterium callimiconis]
MSEKFNVVMSIKPGLPEQLLTESMWRRLHEIANIEQHTEITDFSDPAALERMKDADYLWYGWEAPQITAEALNAMPKLKGIIAAQGSAYKALADEARQIAKDRGIFATNVQAANSIPVAEYCLGVALLESKDYTLSQRQYGEKRAYINREVNYADAGTYGKTIGIVTATAQIARDFMQMLKPFDFNVLAWSRHLTDEEAAEYGAKKVDLDTVFRESDIVSIHTPGIPQTAGMIGAHELGLMKDGALLLNSARGIVIDHKALEKELVSGRIRAVLDVTDPEEPLPADSPLWDLPNVVLTPHIAGSMGCDLNRMGASVLAEFEHIAAGEPPVHFEANPLD